MSALWPSEMPGQERFAGADHVEAWGGQVGEVAQARHAVHAMRIVGQQRAPSGTPRRRHREIVAGVERPIERVLEVGAGLLGVRRGAAQFLGGERHGVAGEIVDAQHGLRDFREVEAVGHLRGPRGFEAAAEQIRREIGGGGHARAGDFAGEIVDQAVAADAHDVSRRARTTARNRAV
jgi:hypothetical protein